MYSKTTRILRAGHVMINTIRWRETELYLDFLSHCKTKTALKFWLIMSQYCSISPNSSVEPSLTGLHKRRILEVVLYKSKWEVEE